MTKKNRDKYIVKYAIYMILYIIFADKINFHS